MKKRSLNFKLIAGGVAVVLIPIVIIGYFSVSKSITALDSLSRNSAMGTARDLAEMTQISLQEELKVAKELSRTDTVITALTHLKAMGEEGASADVAALNAMLARIAGDFGKDYENFLIVDASGIVVGDSVGGKIKGLSLADRAGFQKAKQGTPNVSPAVKSKVTGNVLAPVATPVFSDGGEFVGAVMMGMSIDFIADKIGAVKIGNTGYAFMVNGEGVVIAHPNKKHILETNLAKQEGMKEIMGLMLAGQAGVDAYTFEGVDKIAGFAPVPLTGWSVGVTQVRSEFLASAHAIRNTILLVGILFLVVTIVMVLIFARSISKPINEVISGLTDGADQVASASGQISSAGQSLAEGASEQAASIEETSSSLEEMSSMTKQNADNASLADGLMKEVNQVVSVANDAMGELIGSMQEITDASEETSKIIKTIDAIAFQTNLLALNAAVEAARAGEAGAGFAVVADEVRSLAMRAAQAAKNTAEIIEGTVRKVAHGSGIVTRTNDAFAQVTKNASKVGSLVAEISAASKEQSQGIGQINTAVSEMDKVVQQNAANAEESASAGEEMNAQAMQMKGMVEDLILLVRGGGKAAPATGRQVADRGGWTKPAALRRNLLSTGGKVDPKRVIPLADDDFTDTF